MSHNDNNQPPTMKDDTHAGASSDAVHVADQTTLFASDPPSGCVDDAHLLRNPADGIETAPAQEPAHVDDAHAAQTARSDALDPAQPSLFVESLAQRLVAAREVRGWSAADVATRLRLPAHIVQAIESEQYSRIGQGVYLRGYLGNYARLVGVPADAIEPVLSQHAMAPPELVASGRVSHSRYLIDRYSGSALYLVLTGVLFIPLVMFAMNMGGNVGARLTPLDVPAQVSSVPDADLNGHATSAAPTDASAVPALNADIANTSAGAASSASPSTTAANDSPLMASFALVPHVPAPEASNASVGSGQLRLSLTEASWVEIVDADGKRLEYATLPAGTVRTYASDKALTVLLGNTNGAKLDVNGQSQEIAPFNHGNVARFKLFAAGKPISRVE